MIVCLEGSSGSCTAYDVYARCVKDANCCGYEHNGVSLKECSITKGLMARVIVLGESENIEARG